jgi:hypothetical protein
MIPSGGLVPLLVAIPNIAWAISCAQAVNVNSPIATAWYSRQGQKSFSCRDLHDGAWNDRVRADFLPSRGAGRSLVLALRQSVPFLGGANQ